MAALVLGLAITNVANRVGNLVVFEAGVDQFFPRQPVVFNLSGSPVGAAQTSHKLYVDDMEAEIAVQLTNTESNQVEIVGIDRLTVLPEFYGSTLVFLRSSLPPEIAVHTAELGCLPRFPWSGPSIPLSADVPGRDGETVKLRLESPDPNKENDVCVVNDIVGKACGASATEVHPSSDVGFSVSIERGSATICFYRARSDEIDHLSDGFTVTILVVFMAVWMSWTKHLADPFDSQAKNFTWTLISGTYLPVVADTTLYLVTLGLASQLRGVGAHHFHSLATIRVYGSEVAANFAYAHAIVAMPILGALVLSILFYGSLTVIDQPKANADFFGWGFPLKSRRWAKLAASGAVIVGLTSGVAVAWDRLSDGDTTSTVFVTIYAGLTLVAMANNAALRSLFQARKAEPAVDTALIVLLRATLEFMVLTSIMMAIPFELADHLTAEFSSGVSLTLGVTVAAIFGRDVAFIARGLLRSEGGLLTRAAVGLATLTVASYVISFVTVFASGILTESGALRNKPELARLASVSFYFQVFSVAFTLIATRT